MQRMAYLESPLLTTCVPGMAQDLWGGSPHAR